jgi:hypothetical protein
MTLAVILWFSFCASSLPALPARLQAAPQSASATHPDAAATQDRPLQDQGSAPAAQNPPVPSPPSPPTGTPAQKSSGQAQPSTAPRFHHRKRVLPPNCNAAPAVAGQAASGSTPSPSPVPADTAAARSTKANCPPTKVVVRQGGIAEPSLQLAGGAPVDQKSHERDTVNQTLGSTEANLKKTAGHQLNANQQGMVNQTRQFMEQAKAAVEAGDLERARTLAWKAQLLSEELVKPEK